MTSKGPFGSEPPEAYASCTAAGAQRQMRASLPAGVRGAMCRGRMGRGEKNTSSEGLALWSGRRGGRTPSREDKSGQTETGASSEQGNFQHGWVRSFLRDQALGMKGRAFCGQRWAASRVGQGQALPAPSPEAGGLQGLPWLVARWPTRNREVSIRREECPEPAAPELRNRGPATPASTPRGWRQAGRHGLLICSASGDLSRGAPWET